MPINIDTYENLAGEILKVYEEAERTMMRRVKNRLARGIDQPGWTERKYGEMRDVRNEMAKYVAGLSVTRGAMQRQFLEKAYGDARAAMISDARTFGELSQIQGLTPNTLKVVNIMSELDSLMDAADRRILRSVNDAYADIVGRTSALVATGSITYREAVQRELNDFADRGITSFVDRAGKSWDMETYAEMATLTAIERATREGYTDAMMEFGYDLAQISDHYGACPICEAWQGVVISITGNTPGYETLADAEAAGVFHPRCMHDYSVYYEGISPQGRMAPAPVDDPNAGYAVRSQQRGLERHIREWKRRMAVAATPEEERAAYARVRMYQQRLRDLIDEYNYLTDPSVDHLPRKYWREGGRTKLSSAAKKLKPVVLQNQEPKETERTVSRQINIRPLIDSGLSKREAIIAKVQELTGFDYNKAVEIADAAQGYSSGMVLHDEDKKILNEYIDNAPVFSGTIYRGMRLMEDEPDSMGYDDFIKMLRETGEYRPRSIDSWTDDIESAQKYAWDRSSRVDSVVLISTENYRSTPFAYLSGYKSEREVLANSNAVWSVKRIEERKVGGAKKAYVYLKEKKPKKKKR